MIPDQNNSPGHAQPESVTTTSIHRNALTAGSMLLEYRLEAVLGAGGFGMTYLARDVNLDKPVAIKEYFPTDLAVRALDGSVVSSNTNGEFGYNWGLERFLQEARTLAKFSHPHIVRVNRYFEANTTGYMVMDYEDGESLQQSLKREPTPGEGRFKEMLVPLLDGLRAVHGAGFLHRDIKPANIFVRSSGSPVLIDFGSARQAVSETTKTLTSVLTPGYAPLEQYTSDGEQGPWTDIYAMGGVLFRVVAGENPPDAVSRIKNDTVPPKLAALRGRVSQSSISAIEWAMALDEKSRPQSVDEWRRALDGNAPVSSLAKRAMPEAPTRVLAASAVSPQSAPHSAPNSAPISQRPSQRYASEPETSGWRWVVIGLVALVALGAGYEWYKRDKARELAAQEAARVAAAERQAEERSRQAEQRAIEQREKIQRDNERQFADREAALRRLDDERARERERVERERSERERAAAAAAMPPVMVTVPPPVPRPVDNRPPDGRQMGFPNDPPAAKKEMDFRRADVNGDGFLTREEAFNLPGVSGDFERIDTNGDGRISLAEFIAFKPPPKPPPNGPPK